MVCQSHLKPPSTRKRGLTRGSGRETGQNHPDIFLFFKTMAFYYIQVRKANRPKRSRGQAMSKKHQAVVQKQFAKTVEVFSKTVVRDAPEVFAEKVVFVKPQPEEITLDVACGPGTFPLDLAPKVRFAYGIDLTAAMLHQARLFQAEKQISNVGFHRGEAERLPYADSIFDLVSCQF